MWSCASVGPEMPSSARTDPPFRSKPSGHSQPVVLISLRSSFSSFLLLQPNLHPSHVSSPLSLKAHSQKWSRLLLSAPLVVLDSPSRCSSSSLPSSLTSLSTMCKYHSSADIKCTRSYHNVFAFAFELGMLTSWSLPDNVSPS